MRACATRLLGSTGQVLGLGRRPSRAECLLAWQPLHAHHHQQQQRRRRQRGLHATCGAPAAEQAAEQAAKQAPPTTPSSSGPPPTALQSFDFITLAAATAELQAWVPAKIEAVMQQETGTALRLRTAADTGEAGGCCGLLLGRLYSPILARAL